MRRIAAVDYGRRRIGLAVCDPLGITVRGLETVRVEGDDPLAAVGAVWDRLAELAPQLIVVGLPLHMSGEESTSSREARRFGEALGTHTGVPVAYHDEGLTSWEAEEGLRSQGRSLEKARRGGAVDRAAACVLLRSWLGEHGVGE